MSTEEQADLHDYLEGKTSGPAKPAKKRRKKKS
jgi:hypothetical protein